MYIDIEVEDVCYIETHRTKHGVYAKKRTAHQITVYTEMNSYIEASGVTNAKCALSRT